MWLAAWSLARSIIDMHALNAQQLSGRGDRIADFRKSFGSRASDPNLNYR
jgi:hypothetical protein